MGNGGSAPVKSNRPRDRRKGHHDDNPLKSTDGHKFNPRKFRHGPNRENSKKNQQIAVATNPFIIFFLRLRSKKPREPVTLLARVAGRIWTKMSQDQRKKYVDLAQAEKKRREEKKRKKKSVQSSMKKL